MDQRISTILIIGATSGLGEGYARGFHAMGQKVIITGRRAERLSAIKQELPGIETRQLDAADVASLPGQVGELLNALPDVDTVFLNAGIQISFNIFEPSSTTQAARHSFAVALRQQVNGAGPEVKKNLAIVEIAPPYVDTALDANHRAQVNAIQSDSARLVQPMAVEDYLDQSMKGLMALNADGRPKKKVGVGIAQKGVDAWRGAFQLILDMMGIDA